LADEWKGIWDERVEFGKNVELRKTNGIAWNEKFEKFKRIFEGGMKRLGKGENEAGIESRKAAVKFGFRFKKWEGPRDEKIRPTIGNFHEAFVGRGAIRRSGFAIIGWRAVDVGELGKTELMRSGKRAGLDGERHRKPPGDFLRGIGCDWDISGVKWPTVNDRGQK
jgi:hypothetical protein